MAIGDKSAQSYGWRHKLGTAVAELESVEIPTPGFDTHYTDTRYAEVTLVSNGAVWRVDGGKVGVEFNSASDPPTATVTNNSGMNWPAGDEIYLFCPHLLAEGSNEWDLKGQIWDLQQRVSALESATMQETQEAPEDDEEPEKTRSHHAKTVKRHR